MFNGLPVARNYSVVEPVLTELTRPHFYQLDAEQQQEICHAIEQGAIPVVPCHRQQGFDFDLVFQIAPKVITVVVNDLDMLCKRFDHVHLQHREKTILNPTLEKIRQRQPPELAQLVIKKDYEIWARHNHKCTDISFHLSWLDDHKQVQEFCNKHKLKFNAQWIDNILADMNYYRTPSAV